MTTVATANCLFFLTTNGKSKKNIAISTPSLRLTPLHLTNFKVGRDIACQTDTSNTSSVDWLEAFLEDIDLSINDLDTCLTATIADLTS